MTILEFHYKDGHVDRLHLALADLVAVTNIAHSIKVAINKENPVKVSFTKMYTELSNDH